MANQAEMQILTGTANPKLAKDICEKLGCELTPTTTTPFSDGEIRIEIGANVRGKDVFVVQPTCQSVNHNLIELCLMLDALKRASAKRVTAVVPYYGYARQDRKVVPRVPISAKLVANFLNISGAHRLLTVDLHAGQIQGFFDIPVDNLYAARVIVDKIQDLGDNLVVVSPDAGGTERARAYAKILGAGLAIVDKRRESPNKAEAMRVIGDVRGKVAVVLDDMIDTAGTMVAAAEVLSQSGAQEVVACATHPVLSGPAIERLKNSKFKRVLVTDTIPLNSEAQSCAKIEVVSVAGLLASAIYNIHTESSVSVLFI